MNGMRDLGALGGDAVSSAVAINAVGVVAGWSAPRPQKLSHAFIWDSVSEMRDLGTVGGTFTFPQSINAFGEVVGRSMTTGNSADRAFIWDGNGGIRDLGVGVNSYAYGINDAGQVVGSFQTVPATDFRAFLLNPPSPSLASLGQNTAAAGSAAFTLTVNGGNFRNGATILWNSSDRPTTFISPSQVSAEISASDVAGAADIVTAIVTVRNPNGAVSNPESFTITPANVSVVQSTAAEAGETVSVSTAPAVSGQSGVTATIENTGADPVTVTVANYSSNPSGTAFDAGGGFSDLQIVGATASMSATANFYYSSTLDAATEATLTLVYFNGSAWVPVRSAANTDPLKDTSENLDGTISGGRFTVVFSDTSTPRITELNGTFFAVGAEEKIAFTGFLAPIGGSDSTGGSIGNPLRTFKMGSTIPLKFRATLNSSPVLTGTHRLQVIKYTDATTYGNPIDATPQGSPSMGNQFHQSGQEWHFNLDSKATGMSAGIWLFRAALSDGTQHSVWVQLK
jgi:probable HAF family extracellular repeat protein